VNIHRCPFWYNILGYPEDGTAALFDHADRIFFVPQCETIIRVVRAGGAPPQLQQGTTWRRALAAPDVYRQMSIPQRQPPVDLRCVETYADRGVHATHLHMVIPTAKCDERASDFEPGLGRLAACACSSQNVSAPDGDGSTVPVTCQSSGTPRLLPLRHSHVVLVARSRSLGRRQLSLMT